MDAGLRDQRVTFQRLTETNTLGSVSETWSQDSPPDTVWADVKYFSRKSAEVFEAARLNAHEMIQVCVCYRDDVSETWRINWEGRIYRVKSIDRTKRRQGELWFMAESASET